MNKKVCSCCGKEKKLDMFYGSNSPFNKADGRIPVCKDCVWEFAGVDHVAYDIDRVKATLRMMDKPFIVRIWQTSIDESSGSAKKDAFKVYMKNIAMPQYKDMNWSHSDNEKSNVASEQLEEVKESDFIEYEYTKDDITRLMSFFGKGFSVEEYIWLNNEYQDFLNRYECDSKGMEMLIKQIVLQELDIEKRRASGEKVDTQLKTLQDLLGSSNLKPVQETGANAVEQETFGTLIKRWENEHPIPEPDPMWKDVDGISKYISVFFTGHLAKMLGKLSGETEELYEQEMKKFTVEEPTNFGDDEDDFI